jgi:hypothetical protein
MTTTISGELVGTSDPEPRRVRDALAIETRRRYDRLADLLGPIASVALEMLTEDIWEHAEEVGHESGYEARAAEEGKWHPDVLFDATGKVAFRGTRREVYGFLAGGNWSSGWRVLNGETDMLMKLDAYAELG